MRFTRTDIIDRHPASPDRPQAAYRRAVRLALIAERYADPRAVNDTSIHRHDFLGEGTEYLSVTITDPRHGTEAHLTATLKVDTSGPAWPDSGCLTLKGLSDAEVWSLVGFLSPLCAPAHPAKAWAPRGAWWKRHRLLNPGAWDDMLRCGVEAFSASAETGNGCSVDLYRDRGHQLNVTTAKGTSEGGGDRASEAQFITLMRAFAQWGALSAARPDRPHRTPSRLAS
ncbi:hypothetical protein [Streptomyces sp. bgisy153]|uniref:hypothetical protein n=1 Tax=Streptomyces sp. bgisy153 TaxID=3413793 RepID=UPI003D704504